MEKVNSFAGAEKRTGYDGGGDEEGGRRDERMREESEKGREEARKQGRDVSQSKG